jgi:hydrogenase expression/formation protein HypE
MSQESFPLKSGKVGIEIREEALQVTLEVNGICEILGFDVLHLANEGKVIVIAAEKHGENILETMENYILGKGTALIGKVTEKNKGMVTLKTTVLIEQIVMPPTGELIPRIC